MPDDPKTWNVGPARWSIMPWTGAGTTSSAASTTRASRSAALRSTARRSGGPQAEGLNALLLMHLKYGDQTDRYWKAFLKQWGFIEQAPDRPRSRRLVFGNHARRQADRRRWQGQPVEGQLSHVARLHERRQDARRARQAGRGGPAAPSNGTDHPGPRRSRACRPIRHRVARTRTACFRATRSQRPPPPRSSWYPVDSPPSPSARKLSRFDRRACGCSGRPKARRSRRRCRALADSRKAGSDAPTMHGLTVPVRDVRGRERAEDFVIVGDRQRDLLEASSRYRSASGVLGLADGARQTDPYRADDHRRDEDRQRLREPARDGEANGLKLGHDMLPMSGQAAVFAFYSFRFTRLRRELA